MKHSDNVLGLKKPVIEFGYQEGHTVDRCGSLFCMLKNYVLTKCTCDQHEHISNTMMSIKYTAFTMVQYARKHKNT